MKVKDVEKLTGLTAKSIRYYESKGLIEVRHEENGYRSYSEEDVVSFKRIKILRYLEFSIEEIRHFLEQNEEDNQRLLREKAEKLQKQIDDYELKKDLCLSLSKDYQITEKLDQVMEEYHEAIDVLESEEWEEFQETCRDMGCMSIWAAILYTGCLAGPILNLFMNIHDAKWDVMLWNSILALVGAAGITGTWIHYFHCRKNQRERQKKQNKNDRFVLPFIVVGSIAGIITVAGVLATLPELLFAPKSWLFYEIAPVAGYAMIFLIVIPIMAALAALTDYLSKKKQSEKSDLSLLFSFFWKHKITLLLLWLFVFYCCISNVTFVTENQIIYHSPLHPAGIAYEYAEVSRVEAAFGRKNFSFMDYKRKGNFSYTIFLGERKVVFTAPSDQQDIERYEEHAYLELEEFDQALMKCGVPKKGDAAYAKDCDLDQEYVDRFCRIIALQPE